MKTRYFEQNWTYDGSQLRPLFAYSTAGLAGDSIVAWVGACEIPFEKMVDQEDVNAGSTIAGSQMVHFIVEKFRADILASVALQRLLACIVKEVLETKANVDLTREGDDLYLDKKKLSISIATVSPTSALIHFAVNVNNTGTPVPTLSLEDLKVEPRQFIDLVLEKFAEEVKNIDFATQKVHARF